MIIVYFTKKECVMNKPIAVGFTIFLAKLQLTFDDFSWENK